MFLCEDCLSGSEYFTYTYSLMSYCRRFWICTRSCFFLVNTISNVGSYFLVNNLGIQFAPQLFSTELLPTRLVILARPTVTSASHHQKKYEVNNSKVSSLLLTCYIQSYLPCLINVTNNISNSNQRIVYSL